jgi:toxin secretion/phage lysis holin
MDFYGLLRQTVPVRMEAWWGGLTGMTGLTATFLFGAWNNALQALAMLMLIDYITGVLGASMKPHALSSKRGLQGIIKKLMLILLVSTAHYVDLAVGQNVFCLLVTYALIGNEGLSIVENCSACGIPVPQALKVKLEQLAKEKDERNSKI